MPVIKSAKKKLRKDLKRKIRNKNFQKLVKEAIKKAQEKKTIQGVRKAISLVNKAAQKKIIHKNKAARLTSKLSKLIDYSKKRKSKKEKTTKKKVEKK